MAYFVLPIRCIFSAPGGHYFKFFSLVIFWGGQTPLGASIFRGRLSCMPAPPQPSNLKKKKKESVIILGKLVNSITEGTNTKRIRPKNIIGKDLWPSRFACSKFYFNVQRRQCAAFERFETYQDVPVTSLFFVYEPSIRFYSNPGLLVFFVFCFCRKF